MAQPEIAPEHLPRVRTRTGALERAREIAPAIEAAAEKIEAAGGLPDAIVDAIDDARLFWSLVPSDLGGHEADILEAFEVVETLARADGSTGWNVMTNMINCAHYAGQCGEAALGPLFRDSKRTIIAGQLAPMGTARPVEDGYLVSGRYGFGSGASYANWIAAGARVVADDDDRELVFLIPRERVELKGNWQVLGLVGTASYDYEISEQFVPDELTVVRGSVAHRGHPTLRLGQPVIAAAGHAAVALGIAERATQELITIIERKQRPGIVPVREQQLFLHDFALFEGKLAAARAHCFAVYGHALDLVTSGSELDELTYHQCRQVATTATKAALDMVELAYRWTGTNALRNPHPLGRCLRDIHGATQHIYVDETTMVDAGPSILASCRTCAAG